MENSLSKTEETSDNRALALLFLAIFVDLLGFGIIIPIIPFYITEIGGDAVVLGWLLASYSLAQFVVSPLWGKFSDRVGRRPVILIGLIGSSVAFAYFAFSTTFLNLFISRILAGIFTGASLPTARAYIADVSPPAKRAQNYALIGVAFGLGFALGPAIGGFFAEISFFDFPKATLPSLVAAALTSLNFVGALVWLPESLTDEIRSINMAERTSFIGSLLDPMRYAITLPQVLSLTITFLGVNLIFSGFESMFPLYASLVDSSIGEKEVGYVFAILGVVIILVQGGLVRPLSKKYDDIVLIRIGLIVFALGYLVLLFVSDFLTIVLAGIPIAGGIALATPTLNSAISTRVPATKQGSVMGAVSGFNSLMRVIGPIMAGYLYEWDVDNFIILGFAFVGSIIILNLVSIGRENSVVRDL